MLKKSLYIGALILATACAHKPKEPNYRDLPLNPAWIPKSEQVPVEAVQVQTPPSISKAHIVLSASASSCAGITWAGRGKAPAAYIQGMALVYARQYCKPHPTSIKELGPADKDALAYYGKPATLKNLYTLLLGLGMRESSGKYCTGRDATASNTSSASAETGLFQTSYDSSGAGQVLRDFVKEYHSECYLKPFADGVTCKPSDWKYWGEPGIGMDFQKQAKECPAFAVEYAALTLRLLRKHYGPINRKEVEFKQECHSMFSEIERIVESNREICSVL